MAKKVSTIHFSRNPRASKPFALAADAAEFSNPANLGATLAAIGVHLGARDLAQMAAFNSHGFDAAGTPPNPLTTGGPAFGTHIEFLRTWLPGLVVQITAARKIDELIGMDTVGAWEDEEIVQQGLEYAGVARPYGDLTTIPLASWNPAYENRTVVRFEQGFREGRLEEKRAGRSGINSAAQKRGAAAMSLEILRNRVGFVGYADGNTRTYGFLNEPNLLPALTAPAGAAGFTDWNRKTWMEITADIRVLMGTLRTQSGDTLDPQNMRITLAVPTSAAYFLTQTNEFGVSVGDWVSKNFPQLRIVTAPELQNAIGGASVAYMYAESIADGYSTDGGGVFSQMVPTKMFTVGTEIGAKGYIEDFSNALAGVLLKRPFAVVRMVGI